MANEKQSAIVEAIRNALIVSGKEGKTETQVVDLFIELVRAVVQEEIEEYEDFWDKFNNGDDTDPHRVL